MYFTAGGCAGSTAREAWGHWDSPYGCVGKGATLGHRAFAGGQIGGGETWSRSGINAIRVASGKDFGLRCNLGAWARDIGNEQRLEAIRSVLLKSGLAGTAARQMIYWEGLRTTGAQPVGALEG